MCKSNCDCKKCFSDNICNECQVRTMTDCITVNPELPNIGTEAGEVLSTVLELIDAQLSITPPVPTISITNVGAGEELYKGLSNLGNYEFRTLVPGSDTVSIVQTADTIIIDFEAPVVTQRTYSAVNTGTTGIGVFRDATVGSINTQFNFKNINSVNTGTGTDLLNAVAQVGDTITISAKRIASDSLIITETDGTINIETPTIVDIPRFIVNSASQAPTEDGTISKPFKTIQGALTAFVGTGTAIAPQFAGAEVVIQKGLGYSFTGNFNYNSLTIILEESTSIDSNPAVGDFICDYDALSDTSSSIKIIIKEDASIILQKSGFRNSGTTTATNNFANSKSISISGMGSIRQVVNSNTNSYRIFDSNYNATNSYNNDGAYQFTVSGIIIGTNTQSIYRIGGNSRIILEEVLISIQGSNTLPTTTEFFNQVGGSAIFSRANLEIIPVFSITLNRLFPISQSASVATTLVFNNCKLRGKVLTLFENISVLQPSLQASSNTTEFFNCTNIIKSGSVFWTNCSMFNNVFQSGRPDFTQVDLTGANNYSTYNIFNSNVVENLRSFSSRAVAVASGLRKGEKFINTAGVASPTTGWIIDTVME